MKILPYLLLITSIQCLPQQPKDLDIDYMLRGRMYVKSSVADTSALGGFGDSDNNAKVIKKNFLPGKSFSLRIDTSKHAKIGRKFNGYKLYLLNQTDSIVELLASDSRLALIAEVYIDKKWRPIEYLPATTCGNSYHSVYLKQNEYWEFDVPKFTGNIPVKLRYTLGLGGDRFIHSNEIDAAINRGQLEEKEGYTRQGLMDPYND